jgi:signal transduction histidine kinase
MNQTRNLIGKTSDSRHVSHRNDQNRDPSGSRESTATLGDSADLAEVMRDWHQATRRLQETHETLRAEVRRLTDELEVKNRQLERKNRLADLGQMATHVAHEVRNSLVPMTLYLSLLRRRLGSGCGALEIMDRIETGFTALEATVSDLLQFTSHREPLWGRFDIGQVVRDVLESMAPQLNAQGIVTELDVPTGMWLLADREMFRRAMLNLVLNALDAMPQGGELDITCWSGPAGVELEVADSGPGIDDRSRKRLFEPFYTTKQNGTGLGLAIVYRIAEVHGGCVRAANCPQGGAAFTLVFPRRALEAAA